MFSQHSFPYPGNLLRDKNRPGLWKGFFVTDSNNNGQIIFGLDQFLQSTQLRPIYLFFVISSPSMYGLHHWLHQTIYNERKKSPKNKSQNDQPGTFGELIYSASPDWSLIRLMSDQSGKGGEKSSRGRQASHLYFFGRLESYYGRFQF